MPIYSFKNTKTGKVYDDMMSIADKEVYLEKNKHIQQMVTKINISSGVVGVGAMRNDNGWKEMQSRIAEAHPASEFAQQHGKRTAKEIKTQAVVKKHQKRQAEQRKKYAK
jgi:predicted nucleic acid-binding Zn ribbon protein